MALFRRRGAPGDGDGTAFTPTKANLYPVLKEVFHPATNPGVNPDDANDQLNIPGQPSFGALRLNTRWSHNIALTAANQLTASTETQATLAVPGAGEIWAVHIKDGNERLPLGFFRAADLEAYTAANGSTPTVANSLRFVARAQIGTTAGATEAVEFYLSKDATRKPLLGASHAGLDGTPLTISRLEAQASAGQGGGSVAWSAITGKPAFAAIATSGAYSDLVGAPTIPAKASTDDFYAESYDSDYMTVAKTFRAIARKVKNASRTVRGIALIARNEDVDASETDTTRVPDVAGSKRLIERLVPAVFRSTSEVIPVERLGTGAAAGKALFGDGAFQTINQGVRIDVLSFGYPSSADADVANVGINTQLTLAGDTVTLLYAWNDADNRVLNVFFRSGTLTVESGDHAVTVGGATLATLVGANRRTTRSDVDAHGEWWLSQNLPSTLAMLSELDDVILNLAPASFADLSGMVEEGQVPSVITRDTEIASLLQGLGLSGTTLQGIRRSGTNPVEIALPIGNGLGRVGSLWHATAAADGNFRDTGIPLPVAPADNKLYLLFASWSDYSPVAKPVTGATIKAFATVVADGTANTGGTVIADEGFGATRLIGAKTAAGNLAVRNDDGTWLVTNFVQLYEVTDSPSPEDEVDGGYLWYTEHNPRTDPAFNLAPVTASVTVAGSAAAGVEYPLITNRSPPLTAGAPATVDYEGALLINNTSGSKRTVEVSIGYRSFPGVAAKQTTEWRRFVSEIGNNAELAVPADVYSHTRKLVIGVAAPTDAGGTYTLTQADVDAGIPVQVVVRIRGYSANNINNRADFSFDHLEWLQPQLVAYQIGLREAAPVLPYISDFTLTGDLNPVAGDIGGETYGFSTGVAHSDQVSAARLVGFAGVAPAGAVTVLRTFTAAEYHAAAGSITLPGTINLAADASYTVRLEIYTSGQTVGTDTPTTHQDRRITAHAAAAADYHWGRVPVDSDDANAAATAARVVFATHDTDTGNALASSYVVAVPNDDASYQSYLFAKANQPQPTGFRSAGLDASNSWNAAVDITVGGVNYKAYILKSLFAATYDEDNGRVWGITT